MMHSNTDTKLLCPLHDSAGLFYRDFGDGLRDSGVQKNAMLIFRVSQRTDDLLRQDLKVTDAV